LADRPFTALVALADFAERLAGTTRYVHDLKRSGSRRGLAYE
jgi:hypothetical protein